MTSPTNDPNEKCCLPSTVALAFNRTSTRLASAISDGTVRVRELASGKLILILTAHTRASSASETDQTGLVLGRRTAIRCVTFRPDGHHLAAADGGDPMKPGKALV